MLNISSFEKFDDVLKEYENFNYEEYLENVSDSDIRMSLKKEHLNQYDFLNLLSKKAFSYIEEMAEISKKHKLRHFGKVIQLYLPIYISNYCSSDCSYCGFSKKNKIVRKHLSEDDLDLEAQEIAKTGIKHILLLTGEASKKADLKYLKMAVTVLKKYFTSIAIEVYPLETSEYKELKDLGVDGLTIYQEVYDKKIYPTVHTSGEKTNYSYRLDAAQRGCEAGIRSINVGCLFGLGNIYSEAFISAIHAKFLMDKYYDSEISISMPRINNAAGEFIPKFNIDDKTFVQFMLAYRLYMPNIGMNVSTREVANFRDNLIDIAATKFSAGSKTDVGGYRDVDKSTAQFEISDERSVDEISAMIRSKGYQPIFKDWEIIK
ncbi:MAG: 2-iminoacetate synthase ThiH [Campylobacteraceae bacterium]|nr:2-iminoacetate synthase ThiH [Campylobacteraceae bacterium]